MNKTNNIIFFASVCTFSFCLVYVLGTNKRKNSRKKIDREIYEVLKKINETSVVLNKSNNSDGDTTDRFITEK